MVLVVAQMKVTSSPSTAVIFLKRSVLISGLSSLLDSVGVTRVGVLPIEEEKEYFIPKHNIWTLLTLPRTPSAIYSGRNKLLI